MNRAILNRLGEHLLADEPVALATVIEGAGLGNTVLVRPDALMIGTLGDARLDHAVQRDTLGHLDAGTTTVRHYGAHGEARHESVGVFIQAFAPQPRMIVFGALDFSAALARVAKVIGFRVTVCDPRPVFATVERFPMADEVVVDWPDRHLAKVGAGLGPRDVICVLTHDPKFDIPAIVGALATSAGYIGAMGSRRTTQDRKKLLIDAGVEEQQLERVMAPIGLDIGARTPAETAVSICAEIVSMRSGAGTGSSLRASEGPIHRDSAP